jgi:hypothetical protein
MNLILYGSCFIHLSRILLLKQEMNSAKLIHVVVRESEIFFTLSHQVRNAVKKALQHPKQCNNQIQKKE